MKGRQEVCVGRPSAGVSVVSSTTVGLHMSITSNAPNSLIRTCNTTNNQHAISQCFRYSCVTRHTGCGVAILPACADNNDNVCSRPPSGFSFVFTVRALRSINSCSLLTIIAGAGTGSSPHLSRTAQLWLLVV